MADARGRRFDVLVVWRLDSLGRNLKHLVTLLEDVQVLGIAFVSLGEGIDCTTTAGRLQLHVLAALAEFEHARIAERVRAGLARVRASGTRLGRPATRLAFSDTSHAQVTCRFARQRAFWEFRVRSCIGRGCPRNLFNGNPDFLKKASNSEPIDRVRNQMRLCAHAESGIGHGYPRNYATQTQLRLSFDSTDVPDNPMTNTPRVAGAAVSFLLVASLVGGDPRPARS
jgi:Resolvase, N terminal domain